MNMNATFAYDILVYGLWFGLIMMWASGEWNFKHGFKP